MNSLERMMAAIRGEPFDRYPFVNPYPDWSMMPHWPRMLGLTWLHMYCGSDEQRFRMHEALHDEIGLDWMPVPGGPRGRDKRFRIETAGGESPADWTDADFPHGRPFFLVDLKTGLRTRFDAMPVDPPVMKAKFNSAAEVEALPAPATAEEMLAGDGWDMTRKAVERWGGELFLMSGQSGGFAAAFYSLGYEKIYDALLNDPLLVHSLMERHTEEIVQHARLCAKLGVHGLRINEFPCGAELISDRHYLEFVFPYEVRQFRALRDAGLVAILEYLGWVEPRLKHIAKLEVNCLQTESSLKGYRNDIARMRKALGEEVCLFSNSRIRDVIELGDEAVWRADAVEQARGIGRQRRFAICAGSPTTWNTGPRRLRRYGEVMRQALAELAPPLAR